MALKITSLNDAPRVSGMLDGRVLLSSPSLSIIHLSLSEGESITRHRNNLDVYFYILSGNGLLETESGSVDLEPRLLVGITADEERSLKNTGPGHLNILVLKIPPGSCE